MPILFSIPILLGLVFLSACGSNKNKQEEASAPVFGTYHFGSTGHISVQLNSDSTAVMNISNTKLQKKLQVKDVHKEGVFTMRNDSLFIDWQTGEEIRSPFLREKEAYSFKIGSTRYKKSF